MRQDEFGEAGCASVLSGGEQRLRLRLAAAQKIAAVNHPRFTSAGEAAGDQEAEGSGRTREARCGRKESQEDPENPLNKP